MHVELTDENFESIVLHNNRKVCVMFWADWAGPCHLAFDTYDAASEKIEDTSFCMFDIGEHPYTPKEYGLRSVPTFMIFNDGKLLRALTGAVSKDDLVEFIKDD